MKCISEPIICTSCGACEKACVNRNVVLTEKENGFTYASCNYEDCYACSFICPQNIELKTFRSNHSYALQIKNESELINSTSGGAFSAISQYVFHKGGVVYGAVYDDDLRVYHKCAFSMADIQYMHGSKYVFSDFSSNLSDVKKYLQDGRLVFIVGLPCQIAGAISYFGNTYTNLLTADLVCNGVPSYKLWRAYIQALERKKKIQVIDYKFRDKHKYGLSHTVVISFLKDGKVKKKTIKNRKEITYYEAFAKQNCSNDVCYHCKYNKMDRIADFTFGGFWAIDEVNTKLDSYKGVSLVLANTTNAERILEYAKKYCEIETYPLNVGTLHNPALIKNVDSIKKDDIFKSLDKMGYDITAKTYFPATNKVRSLLSEVSFVVQVYNIIQRLLK